MIGVNMKKILFIFITFLLLLSVNVHADDTCTKEELARLKELAEKVEINYDYEFKEVKQNGEILKYPIFSLTATNLNRELKVLIIENYLEQKYKEFKDGDKTTATIKDFKEGDKINITIKAFVPNKCSGKTVGSKTIKIPYYNRYSKEDICKSYPEFKYCSEFTEKIVTLNEFNNEMARYMITKSVEQKIDVESEESWSLLMIIASVVGFLIIIVIITTIIVKKRRKNSL